jgi:hypothetical protein
VAHDASDLHERVMGLLAPIVGLWLSPHVGGLCLKKSVELFLELFGVQKFPEAEKYKNTFYTT